MRRLTIASTAAVAALALVALSAAPASAAELPTTDALYGITSESVYTVTTTGASTFLAAVPPAGGKYGADFDVNTGKAYYFADTNPDCTLYSLDPATGASTLVGIMVSAEINECDALNVALDGTLRVADQDGVLLTVDKATGAVLGSVTVVGITAISFIDQTSDGVFYAGDYNGTIYTLDVNTGAATYFAQPTDYIETASFDSANTLWIDGDGEDCQGLNSLSLADPLGSFLYQGDFFDGEECLSTFATFITQPLLPAKLAATGAAPSAAVVAPFALLALIAGVGALVMARQRRAA